MSLTQEDILRSGYRLPADAPGAWRTYDEEDPIPGYFQFDWLSSRHPDLYHQFALSSIGLMNKLHTLIDLTGCDVIDIGAGTGRSAAEAARKARRVFAVDLYHSVADFGRKQLRENQITNVFYINGDREHLPFRENSMDCAISVWAEINLLEAYRVLKPQGTFVQMGAIPNALCGEITEELIPDYEWLPKECAPREVFEPGYPDTSRTVNGSIWGNMPVSGPIEVHEFTYLADYEDYSETAAIAGRLYGPKAKNYFISRKQSTFSWRLQIIMGRVRK